MRTTRKLLSLFLAMVMVIGLLPVSALADGTITADDSTGDVILSEAQAEPKDIPAEEEYSVAVPEDGVIQKETDAADTPQIELFKEPEDKGILLKTEGTRDITASGTCGDNLTWELTDDGTLTISGTGAMKDYIESSVPWKSYRETIKMVVIGSGATSIGNNAFSRCSALESIELPDTLTTIGQYAFYLCSSLKSLEISETVTNIKSYAFAGCSSLTRITLPSELETIPSNMLKDCSSLTSITIPSQVSTIGYLAFINCTNLKTITFVGSAPSSIDSEAFENVTATVYYPGDNATWTEDVMQDYGGTLTWKDSCDLYILGVGIADNNLSGLIDNSLAYTYDPNTKTLSLQGNYNVKAGDPDYVIRNEGVDGLTIRLDNTVRLYAPEEKDMTFLVLNADTTIKSASSGCQLQVFGNTGVTTGIEVGGGVALVLEDTDLYFSSLVYGLLGSSSGESRLDLVRATGYIRSTWGAVRSFSGRIYTLNCKITEPENYTIGSDYSICKSDGTTVAPRVSFEPDYGLVIDGVPVTDENRSDVLGNGVFSFDGVHTLTVSGNYIGTAAVLIECNLYSLVVNTPGVAVLKNNSDAESTALIHSTGDVFIGGSGNLFLQGGDNAGDNSYGIHLEGISKLSVQSWLSVKNVAYGLAGSDDGREQSLQIYNASVTINSFTAAATGFDGGITTENCAYVYPAYTIAQDGALGLDSISGFDPAVNIQITDQEAYDLIIDGTRVYAGNREDIRGAGVFSFDPGTGTLTVRGTYEPEIIWAYTAINRFQPVIDSWMNGLVIELAGDTTLVSNRENYATYTPVINSTGSRLFIQAADGLETMPVLTLTSANGMSFDGVHSNSLTISNVDLRVTQGAGKGLFGTDGSELELISVCADVWGSAPNAPSAAVTGYTGGITLDNCSILNTNASVSGGAILGQGEVAGRVLISKGTNVVYDLYVDGTQLSAGHLSVMGGTVTYDPAANTLTLYNTGAAMASSILPYIENHIPGLTIVVASGITLSTTSTANDHGIIESDQDLTITSSGNASRLVLDGSGSFPDGIRMLNGADLTVQGARLLVQNVRYGLVGSAGSALTLFNSWVEIAPNTANAKAVSGFMDGITLEADEIKSPSTAYVDGDRISDSATGTYATGVTIEPPAHYHDETSFFPWLEENCLPSEPGSYVLFNDVTLSETWTVPTGTVDLCLNGHKIKRGGSEKYSVIKINYNTTLNLYDCSETPGEITGGYADNGGGVYIGSGSTFNMYGGSISSNMALDSGGGVLNYGTFNLYGGEIRNNWADLEGGGVYNGGPFTMYGGRICSNTASPYGAESHGGGVYQSGSKFIMYVGEICGNKAQYGGGVYLEGGTFQADGGTITGNTVQKAFGGVYVSGGTLAVSGAPVIAGNGKSGRDDVRLSDNKVITVTGELTEGADIGVSMYTPYVFTSGYSTYNSVAPAAYFFSDIETYGVGLTGGEATLTAEMYTVTFDVQGHGTEIAAQIIGAGSPAVRPADPNEENWIFGGWYTDAACTAEYDFSALVTVDLTLYAKWTPVTHTVTFRHNCEFAANIAMHYLVPKADVEGYDSIALEIEMEKYAEDATEPTIETRTISKWSDYTLNGEEYCHFVFPGIFAAEMGNRITARVSAVKDGETVYSQADEYSVKDYAYSRLEKTSSATYRTLLVDMLNYGSAAQTHFKKNAGNPVNADLTETQAAWGTQEELVTRDNESTETLAGATAEINGKNLVFDSSVFLRYRMAFAEGQDMSKVKIVFTYPNLKGEVQKQTVKASRFGTSGSYYTADCTNIIPSAMRQIVSATIYDGNTPISSTLNYSIETYVHNRLIGSSQETFKVLITEMLRYGISAEKHFG